MEDDAREDALDVLPGALAWRLTGSRWRAVEQALNAMGGALANALVVHLFVAVNGDHRAIDLRYLLSVWQACGDTLGMMTAVAGFTVDPEPGWDAATGGLTGMLAARTRPGEGVHQAILCREHDALCLSVMREPASAEGIGWIELNQESGRLPSGNRPPG